MSQIKLDIERKKEIKIGANQERVKETDRIRKEVKLCTYSDLRERRTKGDLLQKLRNRGEDERDSDRRRKRERVREGTKVPKYQSTKV